MKIVLISSNIAESPYPIYPLGLSMIAGALTNAGHNVEQFDFLQLNKSLDSLGHKIEIFMPELIGISIRNIDNANLLNEERYLDVVKDIVTKIRENSKAKIVLGGAGFSLMSELILHETGADYGIIGEGESLMVEFVANAANNIYPEKPLIGPETRLHGLEIPSAKYVNNLMKIYLKMGNVASVQTKRGCTKQCIYCPYPLLEGSKIRLRHPPFVIDDIIVLRDKFQAQNFFFTDSVFNDSEGRYLQLINEMKKREVNVPWTAFFTPNNLNDEIVELMKSTGLKAAEIGSDAPTDITLKKLGKGFTFKEIEKCNELLTRHSIATAHYFMFGCPGETEETVLEGIDNLKSLEKCVIFIFMGIRILPGTALARLAVKDNLISPDNELLEPVYYISPLIDKKWLEETLIKAFSKTRHCIFPPDSLDSGLRILHELGYSGSLWEMLIPKEEVKRSRKSASR